VVEAISILRCSEDALDARVHRVQAVLLAALWRLDAEAPEDLTVLEIVPEAEMPNQPSDDDAESVDLAQPTPRSLADYRKEYGMTIPQFTDWLGIPHHEYAAVVYRMPVDPRLREQIAFRLGVSWRQIAEFLPPQPPPRPQLVPLPAPDAAEPPREPWYLVDDLTGKVLSGPHHEPLPANAAYLGDPLTFTFATRAALCYAYDFMKRDCESGRDTERGYNLFTNPPPVV
jgi:hypothetical protein